jgi:hypothetical protein
MPFEVYKSRVKIVRDEEVVKKWVDDQSWKTEFICLNLPEAVRLGSMEAVERHFRETHKENIIKQVESHRMNGQAARSLRSPELTRLVRAVTEDQRRFPLQIATVLSQQFASHGLQFFKVNKTITHVAVARPHYLDLSLTPVSDGVKRIVDYINLNPKCTRRRLVEALAPTPAPPQIPVAPVTDAPAGEAQPAPAASDAPTPEQTAVIADLHWLIHQGHVIEFANGLLECAKKPVPKPPKPEKPKVETATPAEGTAAEGIGGTTVESPSAATTEASETPPAPAEAAAVNLEAQVPEPPAESPTATAPEAETSSMAAPAPATPTPPGEPSGVASDPGIASSERSTGVTEQAAADPSRAAAEPPSPSVRPS